MRRRNTDGGAVAANATNPQMFVGIAICLLALIGLLLAGTIVLALIPIYLANKNVNADSGSSTLSLSGLYASDATDGRSLVLGNTGSVSNQFADKAALGGNGLRMNSGDFVPLQASTTSGRKRQVISGNTVTCERPTNLGGDVFVTQFSIPYPSNCAGIGCRRRFMADVKNALRFGYQQISVQMNFTTGEVRTVNLVFCSFADIDVDGCTTETRSNIYAIGLNRTLYTFNPTNYQLTSVGTLNCSNSSGIYSIGLQRNGVLWVLLNDGGLYRYYLSLGECRPTTFSSNGSNSDISLFAMTFLKSATSNDETFFVSKQNDPPNTLGIIDPTTLTISDVANYTNITGYAELAGFRSSGRLFGLFLDDTFTIAEINPSNAQILSKYPLANNTDHFVANYAFASYNNQFFFFEGNGSFTNSYIVDPSNNVTRFLTQLSPVLYSTSASSCLGA